VKKLIIWVLAIGTTIICGLLIYIFLLIHSQVDEITTIAVNAYHKNVIESLTDLINSENFSSEKRNDAIWALGQLANPKALPFLEKINSETSDINPYDRKHGLCKKEIEMAIKWCKNDQLNVTKWMYRHMNQ
jgi:hypothetical protein